MVAFHPTRHLHLQKRIAYLRIFGLLCFLMLILTQVLIQPGRAQIGVGYGLRKQKVMAVVAELQKNLDLHYDKMVLKDKVAILDKANEALTVMQKANISGIGPEFRRCTPQNKSYESSYLKMKAFAQSSPLSQSAAEAIQFTEDWLQFHRCEEVVSYQQKFQRLYGFATQAAYLGMGQAEAQEYALNSADVLCPDIAIEQEYLRLFRFAQSPAGPGKSAEEAKEYALQEIGQMGAFSCAEF